MGPAGRSWRLTGLVERKRVWRCPTMRRFWVLALPDGLGQRREPIRFG